MNSTIEYVTECKVCATPMDPVPEFSRTSANDRQLKCSNCGHHRFTFEAWTNLRAFTGDAKGRARMAHAVRKRPADELIDSGLLETMNETATLPKASERIDNLVRYMADNFEPGQATLLRAPHLMAAIGTASSDGAAWVIGEAVTLGYITPDPILPRKSLTADLHNARLATAGWTRYETLMRDGAGSDHAFMAMAFDEPAMLVMYGHMQDAVRDTGFKLRKTDDPHQVAGSILNRMRVEIHTARFVICDLTHDNRGAYWEAGFAEGIGRPVIYTCERGKLQSTDSKVRPHFDTAQELTIGWDLSDPAPAMRQLKDAIRATLPKEARMEDPLVEGPAR